MMAGAAVTMLLLAGCADGPYYSGPYDSPYYPYYGPYYSDGGVVVLNRHFYGHRYYGRGFAYAGGYQRGGWRGHGGFHHH